MKALLDRTATVWRKEEGSWLLLVFLLTTLFFVPFLRAWFPMLAPASTAAFVLLVVTGVLVVSGRAWAMFVACLLAGAAIALEVARQVSGGDPFAPWRVGATLLTVGVFTVVTLLRVFAPGPVTTHRLVFAVCAYLLVGLSWALAYELLEVTHPGSFHSAEPPTEGAYPPLLYLSFVTLSTVGYGDVTPATQAARALSNVESLIGVLYPAVLIGRLVSMHVSDAPKPGTVSDPPPPRSPE